MKNTTAQLAIEILKLLDPTLEFMDWENGDGEEIGTKLRGLVAALESDIAQAVEPVDCQFQSADGRWHSFLNEQHKANTIASGEWPIRTLYTAPQEPAAPAWMPIESAPKDKTVLVLPGSWNDRFASTAQWDNDKYAKRPKPYWRRDDCFGKIGLSRDIPPTHWMPLPTAPGATS